MREYNMKRWRIHGLVAIGLVSAVIVVLSGIQLNKLKPYKPPVQNGQNVSDNNIGPVPIKGPTQYWRTDTVLFLSALRLQEDNLNECPENPWQFTKIRLDDIASKYPELHGGDLSDVDYAAQLVIAHSMMYPNKDGTEKTDQRVAAEHVGGCRGYTSDKAQKYGDRVQNTLWDWETRHVNPTRESVELKTYDTPAPWEGSE